MAGSTSHLRRTSGSSITSLAGSNLLHRVAEHPAQLVVLDSGTLVHRGVDDFLLLLRWNQDHAGERRQIFETRRDYRYSGGRLARAIRRLFGGRHRRHVPDGQQPGSDRKESSTPGKSSAREGTIPHPYLVLGISIDASGEEVRAAFKDLVRKYHPDKQHGAGAESMESATRRLKELIKAYEELEGQT